MYRPDMGSHWIARNCPQLWECRWVKKIQSGLDINNAAIPSNHFNVKKFSEMKEHDQNCDFASFFSSKKVNRLKLSKIEDNDLLEIQTSNNDSR